MKIKITRGPIASAVRAVIYGTEGIGKTTLASQFPNPLIIDTEDGSKHIDCARYVVSEWKNLTLAMAELAVDAQGFQTIVIDSADWAEKLLVEWVLSTSGKKSIEDFGFGKGYIRLQEAVTEFLRSADKLVANGLNVVFVAHSKVQRTSPPDQTDGFDRYELKLTKQVAPLFKEWCDVLLFCNYKTRLVEGADGRMKASGGKARLMYAERSAAWDAKNRFNLPEEMPMCFSHLAGIFGPPAAVASAPDAMATMTRASAAIAVADVKKLSAIEKKIDGLLKDATATDAQLTESQWEVLTDQIQSRRAVLAPTEEVLA